ncbi:hypothetical protein ONZ45_g18081 [Pleurotus djamor]|nr:hypothetical protein ONZ45_g18081 [Pleurotus djamor]
MRSPKRRRVQVDDPESPSSPYAFSNDLDATVDLLGAELSNPIAVTPYGELESATHARRLEIQSQLVQGKGADAAYTRQLRLYEEFWLNHQHIVRMRGARTRYHALDRVVPTTAVGSYHFDRDGGRCHDTDITSNVQPSSSLEPPPHPSSTSPSIPSASSPSPSALHTHEGLAEPQREPTPVEELPTAPTSTSTPPPPSLPQTVKLSLKDFAMRRKKQREEEAKNSPVIAEAAPLPVELGGDKEERNLFQCIRTRTEVIIDDHLCKRMGRLLHLEVKLRRRHRYLRHQLLNHHDLLTSPHHPQFHLLVPRRTVTAATAAASHA